MAARGRKAWTAAVAAALLVGSATARAADAPAETKPDADRREAMAILRDLRTIAEAVRAETNTTAAAGSADEPLRKAGRPSRTVTKSALDSAAVDAMLERLLAESKTVPARLTSDEEFVRRVCLDVTGKLPTPEQVLAFLNNKGRDKRAELIDHLLGTDDYTRNWARYWRDVISYHATNQAIRLIGYDELEGWLAAQFKANRPWDEIASALITANGTSAENGAVGFALAHADGRQIPPAEVAGEVSRIFLGVQIQCAQCHDHPSDIWKRAQFHEFAAFFAGTRANRRGGAMGDPEVVTRGRAAYTMPDLADPNKQIPVAPRFFLADDSAPGVPGGLNAQQRRELAASYVTGQDNPWFARAYVNRIWYALTGDAFYTPVDDLGPTREAKGSEVLDALADAWQQGGYDVRWLFRIILNTKAYQRDVRSTASASGRTPFAAVCSGRLRADQIFDNLFQALDLPTSGPALRRSMGQGAAAGAGPRGQRDPRAVFNFVFGVDPSTPVEDITGTIPQALALMNSPLFARGMSANRGTVLAEILAKYPDNRAALDALYLKILARRPNADEVRTCGNYLTKSGDRRAAFEDILWALVNSTEFISKR